MNKLISDNWIQNGRPRWRRAALPSHLCCFAFTALHEPHDFCGEKKPYSRSFGPPQPDAKALESQLGLGIWVRGCHLLPRPLLQVLLKDSIGVLYRITPLSAAAHHKCPPLEL